MILLSFGHGYSAQALERRLAPQGWRIIGTTRDPEKAEAMRARGIEARLWGEDLSEEIAEATHILSSAGPRDDDPVLAEYGAALRAASPEWVGYLSTTGVYGDHGGDWVDETTPLHGEQPRGKARIAAEAAWADTGLPVHIFRLGGIYGPGRGPFSKVKSGKARRIIKEGQVFSRSHVEDIAQALEASMNDPDTAFPAIYNVVDDLPAPPQDVLTEAARLLEMPPPPEYRFEDADMSPMARSFYAENKRVRNDKLKERFDLKLLYPDYHAGLSALLKADPPDA
ncbi:SDR family oxidoreductase [Paracoccaceae bacterium GXU_MW_L88]